MKLSWEVCIFSTDEKSPYYVISTILSHIFKLRYLPSHPKISEMKVANMTSRTCCILWHIIRIHLTTSKKGENVPYAYKSRRVQGKRLLSNEQVCRVSCGAQKELSERIPAAPTRALRCRFKLQSCLWRHVRFWIYMPFPFIHTS